MKKNLLFIVVWFTLLLAGCGKDDSFTLSSSDQTLYYGDDFQIKASPANSISYSSENEYHATVSSSGRVTAGRVGSTNIIVSNGSDTKKLRITVTPKYNLYPEPNLELGISSRAALIAKHGTPSYETIDFIRYENYSPAAPQLVYTFDKNNILETTNVLVRSTYGTELGRFMAERYLPIVVSEEDGLIILVNGMNNKTITMGIGMELNNTLTYWEVMYYPSSVGSRGSSRIRDNMTLFNESLL